MNKFLIIIVLLFTWFLPHLNANSDGAETILLNRLSKLPDILVSYGKKTITKSDAVKLLKNHDLTDADDIELLERLKDAIEEQIYLDIVAFFLEKYNFKPSYQMTYDYLETSQKKLPTELVGYYNKGQNLSVLASDKNYQLTVAALLYLKKHYPETTKVTLEEIEFFYRVNQNIFRYDAQLAVNFLAIEKKIENSKELINKAHSQLKQGVKFDNLAEEFNKNLPEKFYEPAYQAQLLAKAAELKSGEYSPVLNLSDSYAIIMVKNRESAKYIPLEHVSFFIQSIIESRKCAVELERILTKALELIKVEYYF